jgi:N-methylhydantoinase B
MPTTNDRTTLMILAKSFAAAAEEMGANLIRSSFSTIVREARDCSTAILDRQGRVFAQAEMIPIQVAALSMSFQTFREKYDVSQIRPGQGLILNDPFAGGQHLNDIIVFTPIFFNGELIGFAGSTAHHLDIGGGTPGANSRATDNYQEGLRLPPMIFDVEADWHRGILGRIFAANVRTPDLTVGDLNAQLSANFVGARRIQELAERYGLRMIFDAIEECLDYSERRTRAAIEQIPDGRYVGEAFIDDDVFDPAPVRISVAVEVAGSDISLDFTGSAPQLRGMFNSCLASSVAAAYAAVRSVLHEKDIPSNDGCIRPIRLNFPPGSVLNPIFPAPVRARMQAASRVFDAVLDAIAKALPERVPAAGFDTTTACTLSRLWDGRYQVFVDILGGGYGAGPGYDGADATDSPLSNCRNTPVEAIETDYDFVLIERYALMPGSGGPGRWRGGLGFRRDYRILEPGVGLAAYTDHIKIPVPGRAGGGEAGRAAFSVLREGSEIVLPGKLNADLRQGDVLQIVVGGGGGYGDPRERARVAVEADIRDGRISIEQAGSIYGYRLDETSGRK